MSEESPTVLILDDDESIRSTIRKILDLHDYQVLEAGYAHEALQILDSHDGPVDAILCDLVLPGLGGREAANNFLARRPDAKILFMSAYSSAGSFRREIIEGGEPFLAKPFEVSELIKAVEDLLAG